MITQTFLRRNPCLTCSCSLDKVSNIRQPRFDALAGFWYPTARRDDAHWIMWGRKPRLQPRSTGDGNPRHATAACWVRCTGCVLFMRTQPCVTVMHVSLTYSSKTRFIQISTCFRACHACVKTSLIPYRHYAGDGAAGEMSTARAQAYWESLQASTRELRILLGPAVRARELGRNAKR